MLGRDFRRDPKQEASPRLYEFGALRSPNFQIHDNIQLPRNPGSDCWPRQLRVNEEICNPYSTGDPVASPEMNALSALLITRRRKGLPSTRETFCAHAVGQNGKMCGAPIAMTSAQHAMRKLNLCQSRGARRCLRNRPACATNVFTATGH